MTDYLEKADGRNNSVIKETQALAAFRRNRAKSTSSEGRLSINSLGGSPTSHKSSKARQTGWVQTLLEGKNVNLEIIERDDLPFLAKWLGTLEFFGEYNPILQQSQKDLESHYDKRPPEEKWFFIEKKDSERIGFVSHFSRGGLMEIGFTLIPGQRGKGYGTEAAKIILDYLFLTKDVVRVQARTDVRNMASQKVLEKAGFSREGIIRKSSFSRGAHRDIVLYSVLKEEWKEPKILAKS